MPSIEPTGNGRAPMLNKVPAVTIYFWIIKILCTTVGETAADYLDMSLGLGLTNTSLLMAGLAAVVLLAQFLVRRYVPALYWMVVVLISVVGTLITDNLSDNLGVPLVVTTIVFSVALVATFGVWYAREKTLSIHSIVTTPREAFYWLAILLTFALGTAAGDLIAEQLGVGYLPSLVMFGAAILLVVVARYRLGMSTVLAFWIAYVLTRPLGAAIGDYLTQDPDEGGLGLGFTAVTVLFLVGILGLVGYLTVTKKDQLIPSDAL